MKLRIRGDAVRLRLEREEVESFGLKGRVEDRIALPGGALTYGLELYDGEFVALGSEGVVVRVPEALGRRWAEGDDVGFAAEVDVEGRTVRVLVEKDFRCLHKRPGEDESGQYPHPAE